jgi:hypothetical protein
MKMKPFLHLFLVVMVYFSGWTAAQQSVVTPTTSALTTVVPSLINFSGVLTDLNGKPLAAVQGVTFLLYSSEQGGNPLWMETQNVTPGNNGQYSVTLGSTTSQGVPADLFSNGEARWLGVQVVGQPEQPRVLLVAVPYALKAADAQTIGGLPPSAFVLAAPPSGVSPSSLAGSVSTSQVATPPNGTVTGSGTVGYIPLWDTTSDIISSVLFQSGSGGTAKIGINNATPKATLDVGGNSILRGSVSLPNIGTATATAGKNSQTFTQAASAYNSGTGAAVTQTFQWQAEPANNDTSTASGTINLLFGQGTSKPAETGLHIASDGQITFATGQTFPGTGDGTITGVTAGTDLTGGGSSGNVTLNLNTAALNSIYAQLTAANTFTGNQTVSGTLTATSLTGNGSGLTNVTAANSNELGGLSASSFAQLATNNTFTGEQYIDNKVIITGTSSYEVLAVSNTTGTGHGISASTASPTGNGVVGNVTATSGSSAGVLGTTTSPFGYGVTGQSPNVGVHGAASGTSSTGATFGAVSGVWGDTAGTSGGAFWGVLGTADDNYGGVFLNNTGSDIVTATLYLENGSTESDALTFMADGIGVDYCAIDNAGDLTCTGTVSGVVPAENGARKVSVHAVQSPENWFEDFGSGVLTNGAMTVSLDAAFASTVNTAIDYHVFLTPNGDCKGLYVSQKSPGSFEVRELGGGTSNVAFDYRIVAKRAGYENQRLEDVTDRYRKMKEQQQLRRERASQRRAARTAATPVVTALTQHR